MVKTMKIPFITTEGPVPANTCGSMRIVRTSPHVRSLHEQRVVRSATPRVPLCVKYVAAPKSGRGCFLDSLVDVFLIAKPVCTACLNYVD